MLPSSALSCEKCNASSCITAWIQSSDLIRKTDPLIQRKIHSLSRQVSSQAVISSCQCLAGLSRTLCLDGGICTGSPHRPEGILEGLSQIHQYNTSQTGYRDSVLFLSLETIPLGCWEVSHIYPCQLSASSVRMGMVMCVHLLSKGRLLWFLQFFSICKKL